MEARARGGELLEVEGRSSEAVLPGAVLRGRGEGEHGLSLRTVLRGRFCARRGRLVRGYSWRGGEDGCADGVKSGGVAG